MLLQAHRACQTLAHRTSQLVKLSPTQSRYEYIQPPPPPRAYRVCREPLRPFIRHCQSLLLKNSNKTLLGSVTRVFGAPDPFSFSWMAFMFCLPSAAGCGTRNSTLRASCFVYFRTLGGGVVLGRFFWGPLNSSHGLWRFLLQGYVFCDGVGNGSSIRFITIVAP